MFSSTLNRVPTRDIFSPPKSRSLRFEAVSELIGRALGVFFTNGSYGSKEWQKLYACDRKTESAGPGLAFSRLVTNDTTLYLSNGLVFKRPCTLAECEEHRD